MEKREYNRLEENPVLATIGAFKAVVAMGKVYTKDKVLEEIKNTDFYKNGELKEADINYIISELEKEGIVGE